MHVIDNYLNDQSEMSAEDMLDEYIEKEDKSMLHMLSDIGDETNSVRVINRHSLDYDFNFLGSKMNDYNDQLQRKLNYEEKQLQQQSYTHSWFQNNNNRYLGSSI